MAPNENLERGTACLLCRRRKQRCDAVKPVCGPCTRARGPLNCVYTPSRRELLEQKVRELEAHISTIKSSSQQNPASERASRPPSNSPSTITSASSSSSTPRLSSTPDVAAYLYRTGGVITLPVYATQVHRSKSKPPASIPRHLEDPDMTRWKNQKDIPHGIITHLTALFLKFKWRHPVEFNVSRLLASLELPPSHPQAPHPSLRNAILLNGCLYADESFRKYEPLIAEHFSKDLKHSLANADRLFDCVRASAFFGCYLYSRCRMVEAHYYISTSMSLAIACGLNTIQSLNLNDPYTASMLKPAHDLVELGDRINMFWMLFNIDRAGSLLTGVPCGLADQKIDTTWPCPSEYYEDGRALAQRYGTIKSLYTPGSDSIWDLGDNPISLRTKAYALLYRATALAAKSETCSGSDRKFLDEVQIASRAISDFADSLSTLQFSQGESMDSEGVQSILATASTAAHSAVVQIYGILAQTDPSAVDRQRSACKNAILTAKEIAGLGAPYFPLALGFTLTPVHTFLVGQLAHSIDQKSTLSIKADIAVIMDTITRLKEYLPELHKNWHDPYV